MRTRSISAEEARQIVSGKILHYEDEYIERKSKFFQQNPSTSVSLRRWIEVAGIIIGGNHYWCTRCPRHHSWKARIDMELSSLDPIFLRQPARSSDDSDSGSAASPPSSVTISTEETAIEAACGERETFNVSREPHLMKDEWYKASEKVLKSPCDYISSMPSKGVRDSLIDAINCWLQVPLHSRHIIKELIQKLHDASLILDDIEDNSPTRRGKPAVHMIFGHSQAINSANFMFVSAVQSARRLTNVGALDVLLEELENLYLGQSLDLLWKFQVKCPTRQEYLNMVDNKTGGMFRLLVGLMQAESQAKTNVSLDRFSVLFGRFFQVRDDYLNLTSSSYTDQKGFCEDLDEGKFSFPIVCCLQDNPEYCSHILGLFRQRPTGLTGSHQPMCAESKLHILECLRESGALEVTLRFVNDLEAQLLTEIDSLERVNGEQNPIMRLLVQSLSLEEPTPSLH
ncbi:hypothetical protein HIM_11485 [Hirsutella minnesotensis 3608]|uniref:Uncharacterized protein n=1 Tax=Hirsutella minnesotensis 3608 TaxID=1043627 RepID=A0A0F7ZWK4_9HYPO|nr:hypothetical protein HIM_11485 [Hirsutella minnesotensis 3608]